MTRLKNLCILAMVIILSASIAAQAEDGLNYGIKVGENLPIELSLPDQSGLIKNFQDLSGTKGLIMIFARSTSWCPYCQRQLIEWDSHALKFKEIGYNIAALTYDPVTQQRIFARRNDISYPVLSDKGSAVIFAFDLLNKGYKQDSDYFGIPHPAIYVISSDGQITHRFSENGYKNRPQINDVFQTLSTSD